ncbi:HAD family phosphatase [Rhodobacterales bacterium]|nr:HAD family phosphatase [Rhodobacterales bacterium]
MSTPITTVVFDIGNVLIEWNPEYLYRDLIPDDTARQDFLENVCSAEWNLQQDLGRPWAEATEALIGEHPDKAEMIAAYSDRWHDMVPGEIPGTPALLAELKDRGVPLFAITNFSGEKFAEAQARFPFLKTSFLDIVVSGDERLVKPDPEIFRILFTRQNLDPRECIFVDDSKANIETAAALGMTVHHFSEAGPFRQDLVAHGLLDGQ